VIPLFRAGAVAVGAAGKEGVGRDGSRGRIVVGHRGVFKEGGIKGSYLL
jgi:hypothetical protein